METIQVNQPVGTTGTESEVQVWEKVPVEIWKKIFDFIKYNGNKNIATLRVVCSLFRNIIDECVDLHVVLNHSSLSGSARIGHVRADACTVTDCTLYIPPNLLVFKQPDLITHISLSGPISALNFSRLVHITHNVKCVTLSQGFLAMGNFLNIVQDHNNQPILAIFWRGLKHLNIQGSKHQLLDDTVSESVKTILDSKMPSLNGLYFNLDNDWNDMGNLVAYFLIKNPNVRHVDTWSNSYLVGYDDPTHNLQDRENIQLEVLNMTFAQPYKFSHSLWKEILNNQKTLKRLEIHDKTASCRLDGCLHFEQLSGMLKVNQSTLTYLSLRLTHFPEIVDVTPFKNMTGLKTLELQMINSHAYAKPPGRRKSRVVGLTVLPENIKKLEILGIYCDQTDLLELAKNTRMQNLRCVNVGINWGLTVKPVLLEGFLKKPYLKKLTLGPVNFSHFDRTFVETCMYIFVGTEFMVPIQGERNYTLAFEFDLLNLWRVK